MTPTTALRVLCLPPLPAPAAALCAASPFGPFEVIDCATPADLGVELAEGRAGDALLIGTGGAADTPWAVIEPLLARWPVLLVGDTLRSPADSAAALEWLERGVQDVLALSELLQPALPLRLRAAIERKRHEREVRTSYATDLHTGLPHQQQLIEHMSHLLALREREPAPMAVLVLRIEGLATTAARLGVEAAQVLRRKVAVRLRAGVRSSDVVAALGEDQFAVLLASLLEPADALKVGAKLVAALTSAPFKAAGSDVAVAVALGLAQYPPDGTQPDALLARAGALAAGAPAQGRAGFANFGEDGAAGGGAANDD